MSDDINVQLTPPAPIDVGVTNGPGPRGPRGPQGPAGPSGGGLVAGFGNTRGAWRGFPLYAEGGPKFPDESPWNWNQNPIMAWEMPGVGIVSQPALWSNGADTGQGYSGPGTAVDQDERPIPMIQLTGSVSADATAITSDAPILVLPTWALPYADWNLTDCGAWRLRYGHIPDGETDYVIDATHDVSGMAKTDGTIVFADGLPARPDESTTAILDFQTSAWPAPGSPPETIVAEAHTLVQYPIDPAQPYPGPRPSEGQVWHILIPYSTNGDPYWGPGLYALDSGGGLEPETRLFDNGHNGSVVWAYQQLNQPLTEGGEPVIDYDTGPTLWGIYVAEFCSLVLLTPPTTRYYYNGSLDQDIVYQDAADLTAAGQVFGNVTPTQQTWIVQASFEFHLYITVNTPGTGTPVFRVREMFQNLDPRFSGWGWGWGYDVPTPAHGTIAGLGWRGWINRDGNLINRRGIVLERALQTGDELHGYLTGMFQND